MQRIISGAIDAVNSRMAVRIAKAALWIDCVTPRQAELLSAETGRKVHVVMNGVNTTIFKPLTSERRAKMRQLLDIPTNATVVGYCGGFPMQRGAVEIAELVRHDARIFGIIIGKVSSIERAALEDARMRILGEMPYDDVAELVAIFDIAVAFDTPGRTDIVGNSNQKVRQALACGVWVMTQASDLPLDENPTLGRNVVARDAVSLSQAVTDAEPFLRRFEERATFARQHLDTYTIFNKRHAALVGAE